MKRLFILYFCISIFVLFAEEPNFGVFRQSALTPEQSIFIRTEFFGGENLILRYPQNAGWNSLDFDVYHENAVELTNTMQAELLNFPTTQDSVQILFAAEDIALSDDIPIPDSLAFIQDLTFFLGTIPKYENEPTESQFAPIGSDDAGDIEEEYNNALDITNQAAAFSNERLLVSLENETNEFPTAGGIVGPFYGYMSILANPESVVDTVFYAMVHANVPVLFPSGLYKFSNLDLENPLNSISRIADIETAEENGKLIMSCAWEDLTADEDFGLWPNEIATLGIIPMTIQVTLAGNANFVDFGVGAGINFTQLYIHNQANTLPTLSNVEVNMQQQVTVTYFDEEDNLPIGAEFIDNENQVYPMYASTPAWTGETTFSIDASFTNSVQGTVRFTDDNENWVELVVDLTENENIIQKPKSILVYPNPFSLSHKNRSEIQFDLGLQQKELVQYEIYNLLGQQIVRSEKLLYKNENLTWNAKINQNQVSAGIYFLKAHFGNTQKIARFIIMK